MEFWKYQGAGNDFVMIDDRDEVFDIENVKLIEHLCDRRFGIGADGLILLRTDDKNDLIMVYFNSDGRQSSMCGNGGRCFAAFAKQLGITNERSCQFDAIDGLHDALFEGDLVNLKMIDVPLFEKLDEDYFVDTGSPHYVIEQKDLEAMDIVSEAHKIRYNNRFKAEGTNVNFVRYNQDSIDVRTYERGVEGETLACGTGVTAVALIAEVTGNNTHHNKSILNARGGVLEVSYERSEQGFENIWLKGPAEMVYNGNFDVQEKS